MTSLFVVEMRDISKRFPGTLAVDSVGLTLEKGEVLGLIGANGAGKSTLVNVLAGVLRPDSGTIEINGELVDFRNPRDAHKKGIAFVQQEIATFATLTVVDNMFMTDFPHYGPLIKRGEMRKRAEEMLVRLGCDFGVDDEVESLSTGDRQMVTIARALMSSPSVIILDEPTSSLSVGEKDRLFEVLNQLRAQGVSFIFISHFLSEVFSVCDRIVVMRNGVIAGEDRTAALKMDQAVEWMVGESASHQPLSRDTKVLGDVVLQVANLTREGVLSDISFSARRGEIVGIWGLMGSGRTELARALVGLDAAVSGSISIHDGTELRPQKPSKRKNLCGYVPEDRRQEGLFLPMSVQRNISMIGLKALTRLGLLVKKREADLAETFIERLGIKVSSRNQRVGTLSGGNQQKVVLARWVAVGPPVFVLDEPMRGLDISAKAQIRELIAELADSGMAILVIDSELSELRLVADRYVVMRRGQVVGDLNGDADELTLMSLAAGAKEASS
jgi:ABC-type sugar transport system ATPase subunit